MYTDFLRKKSAHPNPFVKDMEDTEQLILVGLNSICLFRFATVFYIALRVDLLFRQTRGVWVATVAPRLHQKLATILQDMVVSYINNHYIL